MTIEHQSQNTFYKPAGTVAGLEELRGLVNTALDILHTVRAGRGGPVAAGGPDEVKAAARRALAEPLLPEVPGNSAQVFEELVCAYAHWSVDITDPAAVARMQCSPTAVSVAAELVVATLNQSLHVWECGPFAVELDRWVIDELSRIVGYGPAAGGTLTAGGSVSNLMALLVARDNVTKARLGVSAFAEGVANLGVRPVVLCSAAAHFSISRAVGIVGVGEREIVYVPTDRGGRILPEAAGEILAGLPDGTLPVALIATAGSTDLGCVDPLRELAEVTRRYGVWLHVDAAYGGGALFSNQLCGMLDGISLADSITLDLHKFGWTSASSSVFLVRSADTLFSLNNQTPYLNGGDDQAAGYVGRYGSSLQTTRRVDALKIAVTLRSLGRAGLGEMVDTCHELACHAAARIEAHPRFELAALPSLSTVVFRYLPVHGCDADTFNGQLRRRLMAQGRVLLARTRVSREDGSKPVFLKFILLNPATSIPQLEEVIDEVIAMAVEQDTATS